MSHFALINDKGLVETVIVAEQDFIDTLEGKWIQTSYNTYGGQHPEGRPLRKNYASIGFTYDEVRDAFIPPQPFPSWTLNEETCLWESPVPMPDNSSSNYVWDEDQQQWLEIPLIQTILY